MIRDEILAITKDLEAERIDDPFYYYDLGSVQQRIEMWRAMLPRVDLFYAVKTNPDPEVLKICLRNGTGFDVASGYEI